MSSQAATELLEMRRTIRIKRSGLTSTRIHDIDSPAIKFAENISELEQAFSLVHDTYLETGYLAEPRPHGMLFGIHSLLPETVVFIAKSNANLSVHPSRRFLIRTSLACPWIQSIEGSSTGLGPRAEGSSSCRHL